MLQFFPSLFCSGINLFYERALQVYLQFARSQKNHSKYVTCQTKLKDFPVFSAAIMTSPDIFTDLEHISLKKQHLEERRKILCIFQELRKRAEFGQTGDIKREENKPDD